MTKLYVTEYSTVARDEAGNVIQAGHDVDANVIVLDYTSGVQTSAAFAKSTKFVRVHTDSACSVVIGPAPTATTSDQRMAPNTTEFWGVRGGDKISVISNT